MKSLFYILIIAFLFFNSNIETTSASSNSKNYARITQNQVYLYTLPEDKYENVLFEIPKTYFVELLSQHNNLFYKAKYIDIVGFVKVDDVLPVSTAPQNPYADNIRFRVYSSDGVNVRTEPYIKNGLETIKGSLTVLDENVIYYGKIEGEEAVKEGAIFLKPQRDCSKMHFATIPSFYICFFMRSMALFSRRDTCA